MSNKIYKEIDTYKDMKREKDLFFVEDDQVAKWDKEEDEATTGNKLQILFGKSRICLLGGDKNCLPMGTLIKTPKGLTKIENAKEVLSYNTSSGKVETKKASVFPKERKKIVRIKTPLGVISCSSDHRWYVERDGKVVVLPTKKLNKSDKLIRILEKGNNKIEILNIEETEEFIDMVDIEVEDNHNFILENGILSHNCGKTNNIIALILDFRKKNTHTPIFLYGINEEVVKFLQSKAELIFVITEIKQLTAIKDSLIIIDEFQKLRLNDRRNKELIDSVCDMIYHKQYNNRLLLCSPNLREINSIIGSRVERWACKSIEYSSLVQGSQLQKAVKSYSGNYKIMDNLVVPKNRILILGGDIDTQLVLPYIKKADNKREIIDIFTPTKEVTKKTLSDNQEIMSENIELCQETLSEEMSENIEYTDISDVTKCL